jgi:MoaA/NifB/PqqE/SkfB family radical SAM enzyme
MPIEYPNISYYNKHELNPEEWIKIISLLKLNNENIFCIFYGGEPFLYKGLDKIIEYCHKENIFYTIISNNTDEIKPLIKDLVSKVGKLRGFTASVDPILFSDLDKNSDIYKKSKAGFDNLVKYKKENLADDVVAEITVTPDTYKYLYDTVKELSKNGIYSSITAIDSKKNIYYDFSGISWCQPLLEKTEALKSIFIKIIQNKKLLVHVSDVLLDLHNCLPDKYSCKVYNNISNVTIDPDGSFRLCLRIRGVKTPVCKYNQLIKSNGEITDLFHDSLNSDYQRYCRGCNWTCMMFTEKYADKIINH